MSAATDALEELNELLLMDARQRRALPPESEGPSDLKVLAEEVRGFAGVVADAMSRPAVTPVVASVAVREERPTELVELLREMKRFNSAVVQVLQKEETPDLPEAPPIVNVAAPSVTLAPNIQVERPSKWRFTVTRRDPNAQYRIQEIIAEIIE